MGRCCMPLKTLVPKETCPVTRWLQKNENSDRVDLYTTSDTCDGFDCSGESVNTVSKGLPMPCTGSCDVATCCTAPDDGATWTKASDGMCLRVNNDDFDENDGMGASTNSWKFDQNNGWRWCH